MHGLSKREINVISDLEFRKKYFFTRDDIKQHFENETQIRDTIYRLRNKGRIIKLNRSKYYLLPIKARTGKWVEDSFIVSDELMNGKDYFISGWAAANFWRITDQIPFQIDIFTTRRQGKIKIMNIRYVFHRTTKAKIKQDSVKRAIRDHEVSIMKKEVCREWMKSR